MQNSSLYVQTTLCNNYCSCNADNNDSNDDSNKKYNTIETALPSSNNIVDNNITITAEGRDLCNRSTSVYNDKLCFLDNSVNNSTLSKSKRDCCVANTSDSYNCSLGYNTETKANSV